MSMKKLVVGLVALALAAPGCTLSTNFDGYFTAGDDGGADGGGQRDDARVAMDAEPEDAAADDASADGSLDGRAGHVLTIAFDGEGAGTVTSSDGMIDCGDTCSASYAPDTLVTLTLAPDENSTFVGWSDEGCDDASLTCEVTMDMARTITVRLDIRQVQVAIAVSGDGSGSVASSDGAITCDGSAAGTCSGTYAAGTMLTFTATPSGTSVFAGWSGGGCTGTGACAITLTEDVTIGAAFDRDRRSLNVTLAGTGSGGVTSSPAGIDCGIDCSESYPAGTMVTLGATPSSDSTFAGWSGACTGTGACTVTMSEARTVTATFTLRRYTLTIQRGGNGAGSVFSTSPAGLINCGATCSAMRDHGDVVALQATEAVGSTFSGWSGGGCDPTTPVCFVSLTSNTTITANFTLDRHTVSVAYAVDDGAGTVTSAPSGISCTTGGSTGCLASFDHDTSVTLTASPSVGSSFVQWSGACAGTSTTCVVTTNADRAVTAQMRRNRYTVSVSKSGGGTGTVSGSGIDCGGTCSTQIAHGESVSLTAMASPGSTFAGWGGACASAGSSTSCTVPITDAASVSATFTLGTNVLTVTRVGSGTVSSSPSGIDCGTTCGASFTNGQTITLTATPATGSTFSGWSSGPCTGTGTCTVTMGTTPIGVTATFAPIRHTLTVSRGGTGAGSITSMPSGIACPPTATCSAQFDHGTMVTLGATASTGSTFSGWSGAPTGTCAGTGPCTVTMDQARMIGATFALNAYRLDVVREGGGGGTVTSNPSGISCGTDCDHTYNHGTAITLTAAPATGSTFAGWTGATGCGTSATCVVTLAAATTVRARFELDRYTLAVTRAGSGTVVSSDSTISCGATCSATYDHGASVTLSATPATGYRFAGWSGATCSGTGSCVVSMTAAQSVTATFVQQVTLTVRPGPEIGGRDPVVTSDVGNIRCFANGSTSGCSDTFDAGTTVRLAASAPGWAVFDGWSGVATCSRGTTCAVTLGASTSVSASFVQLGNVVFVTSATYVGDLGGPARADDICVEHARSAGLPPVQYRAWLSTSSQSAQDRGIDGVDGYVRPDGLPVAYIAKDLVTGTLRHPIGLDETGTPVPVPALAWTGTMHDGSIATETCDNWLSARTTSTAVVGHVERGGGEWTAALRGADGIDCSVPRRLYCFGVGATYPARTPLPVANAGYAFVSSRAFTGSATVATMDSGCQMDATAAGFSGTYVAFVSTPTQSAGARITYAGPFYRPDGWLVGGRPQLVSAMGRLATTMNQLASGDPYANAPGWMPAMVWTGHANGSPSGAAGGMQTCAGWTSSGALSSGRRGVAAGASWNRWGEAELGTCSQALPVYCVRQN
ncbi:Flagellar hook-length control protein FliK [Sandaracinus amylolyticus]|uniref:Flagellar hook-length control protein FliK n=2 Tax=Sandaracinus amylolyticus TaxID=927083 RepID=A0A0F6YMN3_9BACT|nr:Flagellar hook-length control protein FliK [Sandaracinus amylolyticus]